MNADEEKLRQLTVDIQLTQNPKNRQELIQKRNEILKKMET